MKKHVYKINISIMDEKTQNLLDEALKDVPEMSPETDLHLRRASRWTNAMGITGIGGSILAMVSIVLLFFPSTKEIGWYLLIFGLFNTTFVASFCQRKARKSLEKAMELTANSFKSALEKLNDSLEIAIEERKKSVANRLPQN